MIFRKQGRFRDAIVRLSPLPRGQHILPCSSEFWSNCILPTDQAVARKLFGFGSLLLAQARAAPAEVPGCAGCVLARWRFASAEANGNDANHCHHVLRRSSARIRAHHGISVSCRALLTLELFVLVCCFCLDLSCFVVLCLFLVRPVFVSTFPLAFSFVLKMVLSIALTQRSRNCSATARSAS